MLTNPCRSGRLVQKRWEAVWQSFTRTSRKHSLARPPMTPPGVAPLPFASPSPPSPFPPLTVLSRCMVDGRSLTLTSHVKVVLEKVVLSEVHVGAVWCEVAEDCKKQLAWSLRVFGWSS